MLKPSTLIVTHDNADFDALASQVAAQKLYPDAAIAETGSVGREVHPYLALHRDRFRGMPLSIVDWDEVNRLVLVDIRNQERLGHIAPLLERRRRAPDTLSVHIYDHHPVHERDLPGDLEVVEKVGSTLTLFAERMEQLGTAVDKIEATLFALGIHADTGSLTYANTTGRDAHALAFMLERGAELSLISRYLHTPFSQQQRHVMAAILNGTEVHVLGGLRIGITSIGLSKNSSGLDEVTTRALDSLGYHALFALYQVRPGKVQIIARSRTSLIDVTEALSLFGGGGYPAAGAAVARDMDLSGAKQRLLDRLRQRPPSAHRALDIMSSPVHTVNPETPLVELEKSLNEWEHSGTCVLKEGKLVAVVSRRDLSKARAVRGMRLAVHGFMSQKVITTSPESTLSEMLELMEKYDVGRLPVLDGERLVGIVTRSDILNALYGERTQGR